MTGRILGILLFLLGGCTSVADRFVQVEQAVPIDPRSVRFRIQADGSLSSDGAPLSRDGLVARMSLPSNELNLTPVLLETDPEAAFRGVRDALDALIGRACCVHVAFRVDTPSGEGAVELPVLHEPGGWWRLYRGGSYVQMTDENHKSERLEIVASPASGASVRIRALKLGVPGHVYFPEAGEKAPDPSWKGAHPPLGLWTLDPLKQFLGRPDVAALSPYVLFEIESKEKVADVIRGLALLRSATRGEIVPSIPTGN